MKNNAVGNVNKKVEFHLGAERMNLAINQHKELAQEWRKHFPSEAPKSLIDAYKNIEDAYMDLIAEEARFLASLK